MTQTVWDDRTGTAGGPQFGAALQAFARHREVTAEELSRGAGITTEELSAIIDGGMRVGIAGLARLAVALRSKPIEFMQRTEILSLEVYAGGLDPLFFLPDGPIRRESRIYMREINPRHQVPESDMTLRNPVMKAISDDSLLDELGKVELELAYLLRLAAQSGAGTR